MRVAVTGATGHVGANLVRILLKKKQGCIRTLVYKTGPALEGLAVEQMPGDVLKPETLFQAFTDVDTVYHLASLITLGGDPTGLVRRVNIEGTANVIEACLQCGVRRLVYFSSIHALSPWPRHDVVTETRPPVLSSQAPIYDRTKAAAEGLVLEAVARGLDVVVVNPTGIIGPYDFENSRMGRVLLDLYHRRIPATLNAGFNWVDVRDVCDGAIAAAQRGRCGERYILGGYWHSLREIADMVTMVTGALPPRVTLPLWMLSCALPFFELRGRILGKESRVSRTSMYALRHHQQVDYSKAIQELDYTARPMLDTVRDTFAWLESSGRLQPAQQWSPTHTKL